MLCALATPARATDEDLEASGRQRARTFLLVRLAEALQLPDEKALQLSRILRSEDDRRRELRMKRDGVAERLQAVLAQTPVDATALGKLVAETNEIDEQIALIPEHAMREAQKILTPEQQARLALFRPELQKQIRRALQERLRGRRDLGPEGRRRTLRRWWRG
jgi:hypothetical protein